MTQQQRDVARDEPAIGDESVGQTARVQLRDSGREELGGQWLTAREDDREWPELRCGLVENLPEKRQVEMLDLFLVRATDAVRAMQIAQIRQLEREGKGLSGHFLRRRATDLVEHVIPGGGISTGWSTRAEYEGGWGRWRA